ncbi:MAG: hypothetical protein WKG03_03355 [Telluria sp.]
MKKIFACFLLLFSAMACAGTQTAKVVGYIPYDSGGKQFFFLSLQNNVSGGCNTTGRFVIDSNQLKFKGVQAAVMAAFHSGTEINVQYNETCNTYVGSWDLAYVCVGNIAC